MLPDQRTEVVDGDGGRPARKLRGPVAADWRRSARTPLDDDRRNDAEHRVQQLRVAPTGQDEQCEVQQRGTAMYEDPRNAVGRRGPETRPARRWRRSSSPPWRRASPGARRPFFGIDRVGQPRERRPCPTTTRSRRRKPRSRPPHVRVVGQERGDLGEGEGEDEVEEQLEGKRPSLARRRSPGSLITAPSHWTVASPGEPGAPGRRPLREADGCLDRPETGRAMCAWVPRSHRDVDVVVDFEARGAGLWALCESAAMMVSRSRSERTTLRGVRGVVPVRRRVGRAGG